MSSEGCRRIVLVGFMGAGKTSVGRLLADRLGWSFVDVDDEVAARFGKSIAEIFDSNGEAAFREAEREAAARILKGERVVVATGGGWPMAPGTVDALPEGTLSVWLDVHPRTAVERVLDSDVRRPLLEVDDAVGTAARLVEQRRSRYGLADVRVDTDGLTVDDVTARILEILENNEWKTHA